MQLELERNDGFRCLLERMTNNPNDEVASKARVVAEVLDIR